MVGPNVAIDGGLQWQNRVFRYLQLIEISLRCVMHFQLYDSQPCLTPVRSLSNFEGTAEVLKES